MIPADLLARLQKADPGLWEKIAETALSEYEYHDEEFNAWISNAITYTDLFGPAQEAWLQHCLQEAIRARGWRFVLMTFNGCPFAKIYKNDICPTSRCNGRGDTEAEALLRAYIAALSASH